MFDMNKLFEYWVIAILTPLVREQRMKLHAQGPIKNFGKWCDRDSSNAEVFRMKPDICILDSNGPYIIADAKWKILDQERKVNKMDISEGDLHQAQSYAKRYCVDSVKLFYPKQQHFTDNRILSVIGKHQVTIEFIPVDITNKTIKLSMLNLENGIDWVESRLRLHSV